MVKEDLIQRSSIRLFEQSIQGGLKSGEIGVIASLAGIGKTSVLVQIAIDKLLQDKKVIHVSFAPFTQHSNYVIAWYNDIFEELTSKKNLENASDVKAEVAKNRVLMNFNQDGMTKDQIIKSLRAMISDGGFAAEAIIIDGFDFSRTCHECLANVKSFAQELGLTIWYSCTVKDGGQQYDKQNIPLVLKDFVDLLDVIIVLDPKPDHIELSVSKDRNINETKTRAMRLDPKSLLISEK
jgi:hypothetical protein